MERSAEFTKAVEALKRMNPIQLTMAGVTCEMMHERAWEAAMDCSPEDAKKLKEVAAEMLTMGGEVAKLMAAKMLEDGHPLPDGATTLEEAIANIDASVAEGVKELEAA